jgi:hypothetical protein
MLKKKKLVAKSPLKATKILATPKPKRRVKTKRQKLIAEADKLFSQAIRLRDSEFVDGAWQGPCITCDKIILVKDANGKWKAGSNIGHFITRGCFLLRWDEENGNLQCAHCNAWRDKVSMIDAYNTSLDQKYGNGTANKLKQMSKQEFKLTIPFLEEIIHDAKVEIAWYNDSVLKGGTK